MTLPLALTQGDPSGIGPELTLKAYASKDAAGLPPFFVVADAAYLARVAKALAIDVAIEETTPAHAAKIFAQALPVVSHGHEVRGAFGRPEPSDAKTTIASIERAVDHVVTGEARAVVTNPIAKAVLYAAGFAHPGHTEFLGELARRHFHAARRAVMMLWAEELAVVPITIHIPLAEAPKLLTKALIVETGEIVAGDMRARFGIAAPRLAFSGLNPHAGEDGALGREEIETIAPAIEELRARGVDARGPFPADTMFHAAARKNYDVALCPTHDQALIPIKTLAFDRGVNVTLGLPFVRTSPDHGTAFDIAGKGVADATSLIEAIKLAGRMTA
ncbi:4-hydroxythreonine-4-phosphate dehydrogenase PdxA [Methylocystis parvus]|uniref:4-hydroxythreonine-4-phosphate dehydrogenase n=1 Tax=Methylocystis parvus TaxID=134 RepID=A0A6B8M2F6_9HYPH|nr:4-hydroxythreonine-4-phosphate dehydrogenase PdxA [Methylocystis parvus]QGM97061.1 4-hydroxythreonine-4-phosphate dehydrogenase PdxA [Methylocystis parvus]WBJ99039.1 4-hydroxythreonine-4-phosphate dehydrogenase PdxA [Methylocystis parvus OBBP]